jgi:uncharacterized membrane protein
LHLRSTVNKDRFEAFSDGVFAFAIRLLVLGFSLPAARLASNAKLAAAILALAPNFVAFALSFGLLAIMWQNHHALFRLIALVDRETVLWNFLVLSAAVLIPLATSKLRTYPGMPASAFLYGLIFTTAASASSLTLRHLVRSQAFEASVGDDTIVATVRAYRIGLITYALSTAVALFAPLASEVGYLAIMIPRGADSDIGAVT